MVLLVFTQLIPDTVEDWNELFARVVLALSVLAAVVQLGNDVHAAQILHHAVFNV